MSILDTKNQISFSPIHEKKVSLSPDKEVEETCMTFSRNSPAIYDIDIIDTSNCISSISLYLNDIIINVPKKDNGWAIIEWFTKERVLPIVILLYTKVGLDIKFKKESPENTTKENTTKEIQIVWKKVFYDEEILDWFKTLCNEEIPITYDDFRLVFSSGLVDFVDNLNVPYNVPEKYQFTSTGIIEK
jgi:hypothetical protein